MLTVAKQASADRFLMQLAVITGVALVAAECLRRLKDVRHVLRALCRGGAFCRIVASLQFWLSLDITPYLRMLPGFALNAENAGIADAIASRRAERAAPNGGPREPLPSAVPPAPAPQDAAVAAAPEARRARINGQPTGRLRQTHEADR